MLPLRRLGLGLLAAFAPGAALAHAISVPHEEPGWTFSPWLVTSLALSAVLYAIGLRRVFARSRHGRPVLTRRAALFAAGWLTLAAATVSPLHEAGEQSFTLHMIEHELLMLAAAPLLVLARPFGPMAWAFPRSARRAIAEASHQPWLRTLWRGLVNPIAATLLQAWILWLWHMPYLFELALERPGWHIAQHLSFLISALFFWQAMLGREGRRATGLPALCLFATSVVAGALGALMAFSQSPWYARYAMLGLAPFGLTPTEDQQLAGLLMWIPGGLVHAGAALALIGRALSSDPKAARGLLFEKAQERAARSRIPLAPAPPPSEA